MKPEDYPLEPDREAALVTAKKSMLRTSGPLTLPSLQKKMAVARRCFLA